VRVLAVDTCTMVGTVAVVVDDRLVFELAVRVRASHGESIMPWIERALGAAGLRPDELDLIAYCRGPGSFTGVRIGLATVKGLALATGIAILGVSSLRVLARPLQLCGAVVCPVIDARKQEVYTTALRFDDPGERLLVEEFVGPAEVAGRRLREAAREAPIVLVGEGARVYEHDLLGAAGGPIRCAPVMFDTPRGAVLAEIALSDHAGGLREDVALAAPAYLRPPDAEYKPRPG
jgi:tRNA threonylcarbamoyladenosine biosynthesis protein TsaB